MESLVSIFFEFTFGLIGAFFIWIFKGKKKEAYWKVFNDKPVASVLIGMFFVICVAGSYYYFI